MGKGSFRALVAIGVLVPALVALAFVIHPRGRAHLAAFFAPLPEPSRDAGAASLPPLVAARGAESAELRTLREDASAQPDARAGVRSRTALFALGADGEIPAGGDRFVRPAGLRRPEIMVRDDASIDRAVNHLTADAGARAVMTGNAVILRGGSEAARSTAAIHAALAAGLAAAGLPAAAIQRVADPDRALVGAMLGAAGLIDVIIPRGGRGLVARVLAEARVPVLAHLDGNNHVYVDAAAEPAMATRIVLDSKLRRTGVCGAMETLLIDRGYPHRAGLLAALLDAGCEVRADPALRPLDPRLVAAGDDDWDTEYLDAVAAAAQVDGVAGAVAHIARHGSHHTDAIVTGDPAAAAQFTAQVDSAIVLHNASTQFADGGEFGFGGEIGIATGRLHARGPVALEGLTTYKTVVRGTGQVRG